MPASSILGLVLIAVGVVLLIFGYNASQSLVEQVSETFTGRFTDRTMWYIIGGIAALIAGAALLLAGRRGVR
jgi:multisubunit Na+/H+ antiporter MnhB subunit